MGPAYALGGPLHGVIENRWASAGGGLALLLAALGLGAMVAFAGTAEPAAPVDEELVFLPGTIARLGARDAADAGDGDRQPVVEPAGATPSAVPPAGAPVAPPAGT